MHQIMGKAMYLIDTGRLTPGEIWSTFQTSPGLVVTGLCWLKMLASVLLNGLYLNEGFCTWWFYYVE